MMVSADSPYNELAELNTRAVGYVIGTRTEKALDLWIGQRGAAPDARPYLTLDRAFASLTRGEIDGVIAEHQHLLRVTDEHAELIRILGEAVVLEPRALAVKRQDAEMRNLLNRTIQLLKRDGELDRLHREYFPDAEFPPDVIPLWDGIGEDVNPAQFADQNSFPTRYTVPRVLGDAVLRAGGIADSPAGLSGGERRLAELNAAVARELASRWGVQLEIVNSGPQEAVELLRSGAVDIAVGLAPSWQMADAIDFSAPYLLHGDRLMAPSRSGIGGFNDLRGRIVGIVRGDETAEARAKAWADSISATVRFFQTTPDGAADTLLEYHNANAIYADSLSLLAHLEANPNALSLTERWYSRSYIALGLPHNDIDFRLLVDYTLQEFILDGTLLQLSASLILSDELPNFDTIPGDSSFAGINLSLSQARSDPTGQ